MNKTEVFNGYWDFLKREDKTVNGVSPSFAKEHPDYKQDNKSNIGCWNCINCTHSEYCYLCTDCTDCKNCSFSTAVEKGHRIEFIDNSIILTHEQEKNLNDLAAQISSITQGKITGVKF